LRDLDRRIFGSSVSNEKYNRAGEFVSITRAVQMSISQGMS
jgi:hypothetical protein